MSARQRYVSHELTHFVGRDDPSDEERFRRFCQVLSSGKLLPGGREDAVGNMQVQFQRPLSSNEVYLPEMICFCDIPPEDLDLHMGKYSRFGIAFPKNFLIAEGANPVFYLCREAVCTDHHRIEGDPQRVRCREGFFDDVWREWITNLLNVMTKRGWKPGDRVDPAKHHTRMESLLQWYVFAYVKFFDKNLPDDHPDNYYMEREWRIIGRVKFQLGDVSTVILPRDYSARFRDGFAHYHGQVRLV